MSAPVVSPAVIELRDRIARLEGTNMRGRTVIPFGVSAIDRVLPGGGLALASLHEVAGGGMAQSTERPPPCLPRGLRHEPAERSCGA